MLYLTLSLLLPAAVSALQDEQAVFGLTLEGDVILGGLFPVHQMGENDCSPCGSISPGRGIQRLEAMLFALDQLNRDPLLLPNVTLGAYVLDSCSDPEYARSQSLAYVSSKYDSNPQCARGSKKSVIAVVGPSSSGESVAVASLLGLFGIPTVSYAASYPLLSDKSKFPFFARTVVSESTQARVMVDIIQRFEWTYVSTVASESAAFQSMQEAFQELAKPRGICIATHQIVMTSATTMHYDAIVERLVSRVNARAVVLFVTAEDAAGLLGAARRLVSNPGQFLWLASNAWGNSDEPVAGNEDVANGALTIALSRSTRPLREFHSYFQQLTPATNKRNPWFAEYWEQVHNCRLTSTMNTTDSSAIPTCTGEERLTPEHYEQDSKVPFVLDAVLAIASTVQRIVDQCPGQQTQERMSCLQRHRNDPWEFFRTLVSNAYEGHNGTARFTPEGDTPGEYDIFNYGLDPTTGLHAYAKVGKWLRHYDSDGWTTSFHLNRDITWPGGTTDVPRSTCSEPCSPDEVKQTQFDDACCWLCVRKE